MIYVFLTLIFIFIFLLVKKTEWAVYFAAVILHFGVFANLNGGADLSLSRIIIPVFFIATFLAIFKKNHFVIGKDKLGILIGLFVLIAGMSLFYAANLSFALRKFMYLASIFPAYFAFFYFLDNDKKVEKLLKINIIVASAASFFGIIQFLAQFFVSVEKLKQFFYQAAPFLYGRGFGGLVSQNPSWFVDIGGKNYFRAISIFPDPHTFSLYLGMTVPIVFSAVCLGLRKKQKLLTTALFLLILALIFTFSRGAYVSFVIFVATFFIFSWKNLLKKQKYLFGLIVLMTLFLFLYSPAGERAAQTFRFEERSAHNRTEILKDSFFMWKNRFIFGVGIGNYSYYMGETLNHRNSINAHNTYLELALELGLAGVTTWVLILCLLVFGLIVFLKKTNPVLQKERFILTLGLLGSFVWFSVNSFFETAIYWPAVLALFLENAAIAGYLLNRNKNA